MTTDLSRSVVLVTGGTGFIGRYLVSELKQRGATIRVLSRNPVTATGQSFTTFVGDLTRPETLEGVCDGVDIVFHLGGHAHAVDELDGSGANLYRHVTVGGTRALLEQSLKAGVSRFLFISSVKAMGEGGDRCLDESEACRPTSAYGLAKHEAEQLVLDAGRKDLTVTILRLPIVYGPGCKGNLPRMIRAIEKRCFPPLPETGNRRSMVDVRDVAQAALLAATNSVASGKIYLVTDGQTYSTRQLYEWIHAALHRRVPGWTVPLFCLRFLAVLGDGIGQLSRRRFIFDSVALDKITGSACYLSQKINRELGFKPVFFLNKVLPEIIAGIGEPA